VSICIYAGMLFGPSLFNAETIPSVTLKDNPSGFPRAMTFSPTLISS